MRRGAVVVFAVFLASCGLDLVGIAGDPANSGPRTCVMDDSSSLLDDCTLAP